MTIIIPYVRGNWDVLESVGHHVDGIISTYYLDDVLYSVNS